MLSYSDNAKYINSMVNSASVRPFAGGDIDALIDFTIPLEDKDNVFLEGDGGCFIFIPLDDNAYEVHCFFIGGKRGLHAIKAAREALEIMFLKNGASEIIGKIPINNRRTMFFARTMGFKRIGNEEVKNNNWSYESINFSLKRKDWVKCHQQ